MQILSEAAVRRPKAAMILAALVSVFFVVGVAAPSLWPDRVSFLPALKVDTDPENMLSPHEPVRVFHNDRKAEYGLNDIIVVGVIDKNHESGVFNPKTLAHVYELTEYAKGIEGVIERDIIAPSTVDNIEQAGLGTVSFEWLMKTPPDTEEAAQAVSDKAGHIPFLNNTLVSDDGKSLALYVPIVSKDISYRVSQSLREKIATFDGEETYHITGLPVAQDTFGVEMFIQMAVSAPMAMVLIFLLMWLFFQKVSLVVSPMIVAMVSVIITMGALVMTGNTVHIMSSMIPVFIMPIAVLDAVHILSDFFDRYPAFKDRRKTLEHVMGELSKPMLFTTLTTAAGFGSLAFTPIPPVQVFGIFIALGVVLAWFLTITLIPAYIMLMREDKFGDFGLEHSPVNCGRFLACLGPFTYAHAKLILAGVLVLIGVAAYGISKIQINDNPVKWFTESHDIRVADRELNERFAGTYMAYLELSPKEPAAVHVDKTLREGLEEMNTPAAKEALAQWNESGGDFDALREYVYGRSDNAGSDSEWEAWDNISILIDDANAAGEIFKDPELLRALSDVQDYLVGTGRVGKINALPDIVKTVHRELFLGEEEAFRIPDTRAAVAQTLITYQNSHRPDDLWHFTTPAYDKTVLWLQLKSGDNKDMNEVVADVEAYFATHDMPIALDHNWFGLTYINTVWQAKMVSGMVSAFLGSFAIVLAMMAVLFRSILWGALCMIPLTVTIAFIYGIIGLVGKDYDMPVAVLSSLSLGLAVDYAIHFLARSREMAANYPSWKETIGPVFGEPARAITRNVIVIGVGFLPLLAAPLVPYKTVGFFISAILLFAGIASLLILPATIKLLEKYLFKKKGETS